MKCRILGEAVRRDEVVIATEVHGRVSDLLPPEAPDAQRAEADCRSRAKNVNGLSRKHILDGIDASLTRLGMDLYQIHGDDPLTPLEEVVEALDAVLPWSPLAGGCSRANSAATAPRPRAPAARASTSPRWTARGPTTASTR
jgi:aryl-alcohol dehydrogenase-like predicted oxidoreductase